MHYVGMCKILILLNLQDYGVKKRIFWDLPETNKQMNKLKNPRCKSTSSFPPIYLYKLLDTQNLNLHTYSMQHEEFILACPSFNFDQKGIRTEATEGQSLPLTQQRESGWWITIWDSFCTKVKFLQNLQASILWWFWLPYH